MLVNYKKVMKIRWGILGAARIADKFVTDFSLVNNGEVRAVAARDINRAICT